MAEVGLAVQASSTCIDATPHLYFCFFFLAWFTYFSTFMATTDHFTALTAGDSVVASSVEIVKSMLSPALVSPTTHADAHTHTPSGPTHSLLFYSTVRTSDVIIIIIFTIVVTNEFIINISAANTNSSTRAMIINTSYFY